MFQLRKVFPDYALLDFGGGRKLERFGGVVVDRPSPVATGGVADPAGWAAAQGRFLVDQGRGRWQWKEPPPEPWLLHCQPITLRLKPTPFGHLGAFIEQAANWTWLLDQSIAGNRPIRVLNLFAYTGGSTLAAAWRGAEVTHVDAAANVVRWARSNSELSGLGEASIRWICDDASKFVQREVRRGRRYDAVILDPPSFGRGPKGERWQLEDDLPDLLRSLSVLTDAKPRFVLLTCHTPSMDAPSAEQLLKQYFAGGDMQVQAESMGMLDPQGRFLPAGIGVRACRRERSC